MVTQRKTISLFLYIPERKVIVVGVRADGQSHAGMLQATAHGTIEEGEDHLQAIERELKEETKLDIVDIGPIQFLGELDGGHKVREDCSYYVAAITEANASKLQPTPEVASFTFLNKDGVDDVISFNDVQKRELDPKVHRVMFQDELDALRELHGLLEEHRWNLIAVNA